MTTAATPPGRPPPFFSRTVVLIPALDEAESIERTIQHWQTWGVAEVRVVDNGSSDATAQVAGRAGAHVLVEPRRGYGAACWTGLQHLPDSIQWILFSSADGSDHFTQSMAVAWQDAVDAGADLVLGDRFSSAETRQNLKLIQRLGNRFCCSLIRLGWGRHFNDMGSLRLLRRQAFARLNLRDRGFGWNIEMQVRAIERGLSIVELSVAYQPRLAGRSKISGSLRGTLRAARGMIWTIVKLRLTKGRERRSERRVAQLKAAPPPSHKHRTTRKRGGSWE